MDETTRILMQNIAVFMANTSYNIAMNRIFSNKRIVRAKLHDYIANDKKRFVSLDNEMIDFMVDTLANI